MPRSGGRDTRDEIKRVALDLFLVRGYRGTSLREIAERLSITKAALYYHFSAKEDLLAELIQPLLDDIDTLLDELDSSEPASVRGIFERVFDLVHSHERIFALVFSDLSAFADTDVVARLLRWRHRLNERLLGEEADLARHVRATVALGGLQDCVVLYPDTPAAEYREAAIEAALRAFQG